MMGSTSGSILLLFTILSCYTCTAHGEAPVAYSSYVLPDREGCHSGDGSGHCYITLRNVVLVDGRITYFVSDDEEIEASLPLTRPWMLHNTRQLESEAECAIEVGASLVAGPTCAWPYNKQI